MKNLDWYHSLNLPAFAPPDWIFQPVWIILYLMIFASFWIVFKANTKLQKTLAIIFFVVQLLLNFLWSTVFFTLRDIQGGFVVIIFMWILIVLTIVEFYKISKLSAYLLVPYWIWTSFALYLNAKIYFLNM